MSISTVGIALAAAAIAIAAAAQAGDPALEPSGEIVVAAACLAAPELEEVIVTARMPAAPPAFQAKAAADEASAALEATLPAQLRALAEAARPTLRF